MAEQRTPADNMAQRKPQDLSSLFEGLFEQAIKFRTFVSHETKMITSFKYLFITFFITFFSVLVRADDGSSTQPKREWGGMYVGLNGSIAAQTDATQCISGTWDCRGIPIENPMQKANGSTQGMQIGYNWAIDSKYVMGWELGLHKPGLTASAVFPTVDQYKSADINYESLKMAQMRFGREFDNNLLYLTGGLAWATLHNRFINRYNSGEIINDPNGYLAITSAAKGYIFGFGAEHAFTPSLSIGCELSQTYFQPIQFDISTPINGGAAQNWVFEKVNPNLTLLRFGVNYKFQ